MTFFIRKGSTEPILKMALVENGRELDTEFNERLQNSTITFSMKNENEIYKIYKKPCGIIAKIGTSEINEEKYYIYYKWEAEDTDEQGTFLAEFEIKFYNQNGEVESLLICPIREPLHISVL